MRAVLAYSGGLDTSVLLLLLQERLGAEVITVTLDLGQPEDFDHIASKAEKLGALKHYTIDAKDEFADRFIAPAIKANALYEGKYPVSSSLSRPLIAEKLVMIAEKESADVVVHGCTGKGNDQVRFEVTIKALNPELKVIAPVRDWGLTRDWELDYARRRGIPVSAKPYSVDENLWGRSIESGVLEDPSAEPPEEVFAWTVDPGKAPDEPEYVEIDFERGVPVALNGERMKLSSLVATLNRIAGAHGVGRIDHIEDRVVGLKSREVYECPAAMTILEAHRDLEKMVLTRHELEFKKLADDAWTWLVYSGLWVEPLRLDLEALIDRMEERVCGTVRVKLYKGLATVVGRSSPYSLYDRDAVTYIGESTFDQADAKGFVSLWGLQSAAAWRVASKVIHLKTPKGRELEHLAS